MLETIRQIGIFMIIAQTVMHFAAGKQYEKYMKIISGVIVLLLFIRPFVSDSGNIVARWQEEAAGMMEQIEERSETGYRMSDVADSTQKAVIQQIEEEIGNRLNDRIADRGEQVVEVTIDLGRGGGAAGMVGAESTGETVFERVRVTVQKADREMGSMPEDTAGPDPAEGDILPETDEKGMIQINKIVVGADKEQTKKGGTDETDENTQELKGIFAQILGITEDRVEVVYLGG